MSRDRYSNFANGVKQASSSIIQVADRWHLLKNLGDAMQKMLDRNIVSLKAARAKQATSVQIESDIPQITKKDESRMQKGVLSKRFDQVKQMLLEGHNLRKYPEIPG